MKRLFPNIWLLLILQTAIIYSQPTDGLIGFWPFTGNANDLSVYKNNGTVYNANLTSDRFGNSNSAYSFNGINSYIDFGNKISPLTNQVTVSAWIKTPSSNSNAAYIVGEYGWDGKYTKGFHLIMASYIQFKLKDDEDVYMTLTGNLLINDDKWHHLVETINNTIFDLWIDGVRACSANTLHSNADISQPYNLYAGGHFNFGVDQHKYFNGTIDDIRLYNRTLSSSEILQLFTEGNSSYTIWTISASTNPSNGGTIIGDDSCIDGQTAMLTATPKQKFSFINWTEANNIVSTDPTFHFVVNKNRTLTANFKQTNFTILASTYPFAGGSISGVGDYQLDQPVKIIAKEFYGYRFLNWTESGAVVSTNPIYKFSAVKDRNLVANFKFILTSIEKQNSELPVSFNLFQNFPNPFNPSTIIQFSLPVDESVVLKVFDALGKEVVELVNRELAPGMYSVNFDASNLNTGVYFYTIQAGSYHQTRKLILMK